MVAAIGAAMGNGFAVTEGGWVTGAILGVIGFLLAAGTMSDWLKWTRGIETPEQHGPPEGRHTSACL